MLSLLRWRRRQTMSCVSIKLRCAETVRARALWSRVPRFALFSANFLGIIEFLIDFILHVDKHLEAFGHRLRPWVYALLFAIVFIETGLVVMPFLPGDSSCCSSLARCAARV